MFRKRVLVRRWVMKYGSIRFGNHLVVSKMCSPSILVPCTKSRPKRPYPRMKMVTLGVKHLSLCMCRAHHVHRV